MLLHQRHPLQLCPHNQRLLHRHHNQLSLPRHHLLQPLQYRRKYRLRMCLQLLPLLLLRQYQRLWLAQRRSLIVFQQPHQLSLSHLN